MEIEEEITRQLVPHCRPDENESRSTEQLETGNDEQHEEDTNEQQNMRSLDRILEDAASGGSSHVTRQDANIFLSSETSRKWFQLNERARQHWRYWRIFVCLGICNTSDAAEILCLSYLLGDPSFNQNMLRNSAWKSSCLATAVFLGIFVGGIWVGFVPDRKPALLLGLGMNAVAGFLASLCTHVIPMSCFRFIAGVGIGYSTPPLFTLCSEISPARDRGFWAANVASFWMWGSVYVALIGWLLLTFANWRLFTAASAFPSALGYWLVSTWVPDSPRALALQGRHTRAVNMVRQLTNSLSYRGPPWSLEEALYFYPRENHATGDTSTIHHRQAADTLSRLQHYLSTSASNISSLYQGSLWRTTIPLQLVWFTLAFGSYGLLTWINALFVQVQLTNIYRNALLFALANLPGNILSILFLDSMGRSTLLTGSLTSAALSLVAFAYIAAMDSSEKEHSFSLASNKSLIVGSACLFNMCSVVAWNCLAVLTPELYPTSVRNTGMGYCSALGRIGGIIAQVVNVFLLHNPVRLLSVAAVTLLFGALSPLLLPPDMAGQCVTDEIGSGSELQ